MPIARDTTLLRMAAVDAGFDIGPIAEGAWLRFNTAGSLATVWLTETEGSYLVAVAPERVASEVGHVYAVEEWTRERPATSAAAWRCPSRVALGELLRRVAILGRVLPDQLLHQYNAVVEAEIEKTLAESPLERTVEVRQRVGQDLYRKALMEYWNGRCAITGISIPIFLRASHAKPWRDATDRERLDVHNGLLLAAHLDIAFDQGFIAVADDGVLLVSARLPAREREVLGLNIPQRIEGLRAEHSPYLAWHREHIWQR
jgi:putative restriction endonuclease